MLGTPRTAALCWCQKNTFAQLQKAGNSSPLGAAVFTIVAAVATLERDLIRERVRAGLRDLSWPRMPGNRVGFRASVSLSPLLF